MVATKMPFFVDMGLRIPDEMTRENDTNVAMMLMETLTNAVSNADYRGRGELVFEMRPG